MSARKPKMTSIDDAVTARKQHTKPCHDCPWRRCAIPGWLGGMSEQTWIRGAHGEDKVNCHCIKNQQCAGLAIYRANVCKEVKDKTVLRLPPDKLKVFSSPIQFLEHHKDAPTLSDES